MTYKPLIPEAAPWLNAVLLQRGVPLALSDFNYKGKEDLFTGSDGKLSFFKQTASIQGHLCTILTDLGNLLILVITLKPSLSFSLSLIVILPINR